VVLLVLAGSGEAAVIGICRDGAGLSPLFLRPSLLRIEPKSPPGMLSSCRCGEVVQFATGETSIRGMLSDGKRCAAAFLSQKIFAVTTQSKMVQVLC
jgi:hypothetical protein